MKQSFTMLILFFSLVYGGFSIARPIATATEDDGSLTRINNFEIIENENNGSLYNIYKTLSTPAISGETFACYAVNVSDFPATIKTVTIFDSEGQLTHQNFGAGNITTTCPTNDYNNEITLQPHETCGVVAGIPNNRDDESSTAAHCKIVFKDNNVKVKGSMEASHWVDLPGSGLNFWARMRVDASE